MTISILSRRRFLCAAVAAGAVTPLFPASAYSSVTKGAQGFIDKWDEAWKQHDAHAMAQLHTEDAVTVNRFGTVLQGRTATEKALAFLHGADGPFHRSTFPRQQILVERMITPKVMVVQSKWQNPVMNSDGRIDPASINDMIVTFVLTEVGSEWLAAEVNLVNVAKMDLPFSNPGQKP